MIEDVEVEAWVAPDIDAWLVADFEGYETPAEGTLDEAPVD